MTSTAEERRGSAGTAADESRRGSLRIPGQASALSVGRRVLSAPGTVLRAGVSGAVAVAAVPVGAARMARRGAGRVLGSPRSELVIDDEVALAEAEAAVGGAPRGGTAVGGAAPGETLLRRTVPPKPPTPVEPPPPRLSRGRITLVAALLAVPVGGAGTALLTSDWLAVRAVSVSGTEFLDPAQVRVVTEVAPGTPLAGVDVDAVRDAVAELPEVASAHVERRWPDTVHVTVTERVPVTAVSDGSGAYVLVDAAGTPFRSVAEPSADVPLLDVPEPAPGDPATVAGLTVIEAMPPSLRVQVERVEATPAGDVEFRMRDGSRVLWGGVGRSAEKAVVLEALLPRGADEYDVSAPTTAVTRG